jgi:hypothetical protein
MVFPFNDSVIRQPLGSGGSRRFGSPPSSLLRAAPTSGRSSRGPSFPSVGGTALCQMFAPFGSGTPLRAWVRFTWLPSPLCCRRKRLDLPGSWRTLVRVPCSMTPVGPSGQAIATFGFCLPLGERRRPPRLDAFEAQSHGPGTPCLRFAESVTLPHARLGSGCWPALPDGACFLPAGFHCKVSGCLCHPSSSPRLGLAHSPFSRVGRGGCPPRPPSDPDWRNYRIRLFVSRSLRAQA